MWISERITGWLFWLLILYDFNQSILGLNQDIEQIQILNSANTFFQNLLMKDLVQLLFKINKIIVKMAS